MKDSICVMKFGGTSLGDADCIKRVAEIISRQAQDGPVVTVVSAMSGVTDRLVRAAQQSETGDEIAFTDLATWLLQHHVAAIQQLVKDESARHALAEETAVVVNQATALCQGTSLLRELTARALDAISSVGERLSARLVAATLRELGVRGAAVDATELIVTDGRHGQAEPMMEETRERARSQLLPLLDAGVSPIVTGFIGATAAGKLTTLGRGGSDYSATILGAALDAREVIIWTDVDGVLSADPRLVLDARTLHEISYNEAAELAFFGAKVLHPKTLRPVTDAGIAVWIRNSFAPEKAGTKITFTGSPSSSGVKAITAINDVALVTVGGRGIVGVPDVLAKAFSATASVRANILLVSQASSQNDICFVVQSSDADRTVTALRQMFESDLSQKRVEHITADKGVAIVAVVGERMRGTLGIAGRTFGALGHAGVNVIAIAQGSSEYNISFLVEADATQKAVAAVHQEFKLHELRPAEALSEVAAAEIQ
ncbi:MAG: aspartate kinase [Pyrinomonadaceae bacterium]